MRKRLNVRKLMVVIGAILLCGIAVGAFFMLRRDNSPPAQRIFTATEEGTSKDLAHIRIGTEVVEGRINPALAWAEKVAPVIKLIYEPLLGVKANGELEPQLASAYTVSEDGLSIDVTLKESVKFSDGSALSANDVVESYRVLADSSLVTPYDNDIAGIAGVQEYREGKADKLTGVEAVDKQHVRFTFLKKDSANLWALNVPVQSAKKLGEFKAGAAKEAVEAISAEPVGTGPYSYAGHANGAVALNVNKKYRGKAPQVKGISFVQASGSTNQMLMKNGSIDTYLAPYSNVVVEEAKQTKTANTYLYTTADYSYMGFNCDTGAMADGKLREAISLSIDTDKVNRAVYGEYALDAATVFSKANWAYPGGSKTHDLKKAEGLMKDGGYTRNGEGLYQKDGKVLTLRLVSFTGEVNNAIRESIASQLKAFGVTVEGEPGTYAQLHEMVFTNRAYDLYLFSWGLGAKLNLTMRFGEDGALATEHWNDEEAQALLIQAEQEMDYAKRKPLYKKWNRLFEKGHPQLVFYETPQLLIISGGYDPVELSPYKDPWETIAQWTIK